MLVKIYQIDMSRDTGRNKFQSYDSVVTDGEIDPSSYNEVFNGEIENEKPESIFQRFNTDMHPLFRGHSLSVSDVVVTTEGAFYCDTIGFKPIEFDTEKAMRPDNLIRTLLVEPHKPPVVGEIQNDLDHLQRAVGGMIECVYNDDGSIIVCNEEAKLIGLEGNRHFNDGQSVLAGTFFIVADDHQGDFASLTDEQLENQMTRFAQPEDISKEETQADMGFSFFCL